MGRSVRESRVGFVQQQADDIGPVFVRPAGADKLFSGFVYRSKADDWRWQGAEFRDRVFVCEPVEFETEVRVYVVEHRIVGIATYTPDAGNPEAARDPAEEMLRAMKAESEQTAGFALDLGKIRGGDWVLVECNDGFALGMYPPLSAIDYARLILARWNAIAG